MYFVTSNLVPCEKVNYTVSLLGRVHYQRFHCIGRDRITIILTIQEYVLNQVLNYQGWFMYMRYTQGQNEEYLLYIGEYVLNQVLIKQVLLYLVCVLSHLHTQVGRAVNALKELRLQAQQFVEDHQFRIASDTKKGAIILEAHTQ